MSRYFMYVCLGGDQKIATFSMCPETGKIESTGGNDVGGAPGSIGVSPDQRFLYSGVRGPNSATAFSIDSATGALTQIGETTLVDNPVYVITSKSGKFLLMSSYGGAVAASYPIGDDGVVVPEAISVVETRKNPHSVQPDPSDRYVFVPNTGADCILQYLFDAETGTLTPNEDPVVPTNENTGPRHFCFHPSLDVVYFVNEKGNDVTVCELDSATGKLTVVQYISTLPEGADVESYTADIHITADGRFLYASNRGHESLARYSVAENGRLSFLGVTQTEAWPRGFRIDPTGAFLFSAGERSDQIASYRLNSESGDLEPLEVYEVGKGPNWITIIEFS
ncbi:MAG: lactonase family protein [Planctomycetota bacterium]|nr:lactonase family protein [Planctomycetota bacterium]MDP7249065.1 lactonase family protein [Planctomycetota bacterium]